MTIVTVIFLALLVLLIIGIFAWNLLFWYGLKSSDGVGGGGGLSQILHVSVWDWVKPSDLLKYTVLESAKPADPTDDDVQLLRLEDDVRRDVTEIVESWRSRSPNGHGLRPLGGPPGAIFLAGPTGSGKTTLAHAIARGLDRPLCVVDSSALSGVLIGLAAVRMKDLFGQAATKPCVLLLDQFDAIGRRHSGERMLAADLEAKNTIMQLVCRIEAAQSHDVLIIAATNDPESLDPALLRRGLFEETIHLDLPTAATRLEIMRQIAVAHEVPLDDQTMLSYHANGVSGSSTAGFAPADLVEVLHRAMRASKMEGADRVSAAHLEYAIKRVRAGIVRRSSNEEIGMRRNLARIYDPSYPTRLKDVGGLDAVKKELEIISDYLKRPADYVGEGCRIPKGILLAGPPGVGKTLLARALAGEADVPFFSSSGSDFREMYEGVSSARVRDLFRVARRHERCVVFIDEIDALGSRRSAGGELGSGSSDGLQQLLVEMSGLEQEDNFVVVGATNRPERLDPALTRSGRFGEPIELPLPSDDDRKEILIRHLRPGELEDARRDELAKKMEGRSGADLEWVVNMARIRKVHERRTRCPRLDERDIDHALDRLRRRGAALVPHP